MSRNNNSKGHYLRKQKTEKKTMKYEFLQINSFFKIQIFLWKSERHLSAELIKAWGESVDLTLTPIRHVLIL